MKALTDDDVKKIARLASLTIKDEEGEKFRGQLSSILEYIGKLNELDTSKVFATKQVTGLTNITREDKTADVSLSQEESLANAPQKEGNLFKVPAIFEE